MMRVSEAVLPGHPDKFCDQVADGIVQACYRVDPGAYCQVEASCWGDELFLTGFIATASPFTTPLEVVVREVGRRIGYVAGNHIDAARYRVHDSVCRQVGDPSCWTAHVKDQSIAVGWAGYDARVAWLPPEHYLAQRLREALAASCRSGRLRGQGPDGKLLVRVRESTGAWVLEQLLVTLQHRAETPLVELCGAAAGELGAAYRRLQTDDPRWAAAWEDVELLVNPAGPLLLAGSDGDNGQTGRKLAVDYYGPRVPIGGGALSGKDLSHIDRAAAYALRQAAIHAVAGGAGECLVTGAWAPHQPAPLDIIWQLDRPGPRLPASWFEHGAMVRRLDVAAVGPALAEGRHFVDLALPWNRPAGAGAAPIPKPLRAEQSGFTHPAEERAGR